MRCGGTIQVDKDRMLRGNRTKTCYDDCYPYPHDITSKNCKHRIEHLLEKAFRPVSKYNPHRNLETEEF
jgi:hypothetical protein